jgi:hypothetical protein
MNYQTEQEKFWATDFGNDYPCLDDFGDSAGVAKGHYFHQDLYVAQCIYADKPERHLDVGSRIDGFITHLISFRSIDLLDIRPLKLKVPNLNYVQHDLSTGAPLEKIESYESVSSLHALEHFGLGRYGDPIDPDGHTKGLIAVSTLVMKSGVFFLSFPTTGKYSRIEFNAQRVLAPDWWQKHLPQFRVERVLQIPWKGEPTELPKDDWKDRFTEGDAALFQLRKFE